MTISRKSEHKGGHGPIYIGLHTLLIV